MSDEDLNGQALRWLGSVANVRIHGTLKEVPRERFERERHLLRPLAPRPYSGVGPVTGAPTAALAAPRVLVERRSLSEYGRIVEARG